MSAGDKVDHRFWAKVDQTGDCWEWTAAKHVKGYGAFSDGTRNVYAHRYSYEQTHGPIPAGMLVDHICHNTGCVNPTHLRLASNKQNQEHRKGAQVNSRSGVLGVSWHTRRAHWVAQVRHAGHSYTKTFADFDDACAHVVELRNRLFSHNIADRIAS